MTFYSSSIKTQVLNPRFHSNNRSEFRLESTDSVYLSNLRLLNVGVTVDGATATDRKSYNFLLGPSAVIRNLYLYDNQTLLDGIENFADYVAFLNYNNSNNDNCDVKKCLNHHRQGFVYAREPNADEALNPNPPLVTEFAPVNAIPSTTFEATPKGYLNLKDYLPLLSKLELLNTSVFKNLRIVIEYDVEGVVVDSGVVTGVTIPQMVVDQILDPKVIAQAGLKAVVFNGIERETVVLPESIQSAKFRLSGFNGKTVVSLLVQKAPTTVPSKRYGKHCSVSLVNEIDQLVVNGANLFPGVGLATSAHRLSVLHDSFGVCNTIPGASSLSMYNANQFVEYAKDGDDVYDRISLQDYLGTLLGKKVSSLDLAIQRTVVPAIDALYGQAITMNVFGEVTKAIVPTKGGSYVIQYV